MPEPFVGERVHVMAAGRSAVDHVRHQHGVVERRRRRCRGDSAPPVVFDVLADLQNRGSASSGLIAASASSHRNLVRRARRRPADRCRWCGGRAEHRRRGRASSPARSPTSSARIGSSDVVVVEGDDARLTRLARSRPRSVDRSRMQSIRRCVDLGRHGCLGAQGGENETARAEILPREEVARGISRRRRFATRARALSVPRHFDLSLEREGRHQYPVHASPLRFPP